MNSITVAADFYEVIEEITLRKCVLENFERPRFMSRLLVCISGLNEGKIIFYISDFEKALVFMAFLDKSLTEESPHREEFLKNIKRWFH